MSSLTPIQPRYVQKSSFLVIPVGTKDESGILSIRRQCKLPNFRHFEFPAVDELELGLVIARLGNMIKVALVQVSIVYKRGVRRRTSNS